MHKHKWLRAPPTTTHLSFFSILNGCDNAAAAASTVDSDWAFAGVIDGNIGPRGGKAGVGMGAAGALAAGASVPEAPGATDDPGSSKDGPSPVSSM